MFAILVLTASLAGQCGPNGCAVPSYQPSYQPMVLPAPLLGLPEMPARPTYRIGTHRVKYDGLSFDVRGYIKDESTGKVTVDWNDGFSLESYRAAKARRNAEIARAKAAETPTERRPTARPEPIGYSGDPHPGGVAYEKIGRRPSYTAPSAEAKRFVEEAQAPSEEASKLHVTVIGSDSDRAPVVNDLNSNPAFSGLAMMVQDYKPDEWPVDPSLGFQTQGKPTILVQTAKGASDPKGGKVVYRASDYSMGPLGLAEAVRKADPNYKPANDPGPSNPSNPAAPAAKCPFGFTKDHWPLVILVGVAMAVLAKLPKKES